MNSESTFESREAPVILIDDVTTLVWSGICSSRQLVDFVRAIRSLCSETHSSSVIVFHGDETFENQAEEGPASNDDDDHAVRGILRLSDVWISTRSLRSQQSGELTVHRSAGMLTHHSLATSRAHPVQYKLEESGPQVWSKGTARGFL